jgi:hypothetical protein
MNKSLLSLTLLAFAPLAVSAAVAAPISALAAPCPRLEGTYGNCRLITEEHVLTRELDSVSIEKNRRKRDGHRIELHWFGEREQRWDSVKDRRFEHFVDSDGARGVDSMRCVNDAFWIGTKYPENFVYEGEQLYTRKLTVKSLDSRSIQVTTVQHDFDDVYVCEKL